MVLWETQSKKQNSLFCHYPDRHYHRIPVAMTRLFLNVGFLFLQVKKLIQYIDQIFSVSSFTGGF